ncbi:MAG: 23S rRNA (pseudouridine(1915)-N(3))-methyltransferase RlmH [Prevotella sp.]|nr:23S rRNA (pseudouridine(1915)-N(3))-methyltransferase RlmH [Prevotella sp.]
MKVTLLFVGKTQDGLYAQSISDYSKRINHYLPFDVKVLGEVKNSSNLSQKQLKEKQAEAILKNIDEKSFVVLLDEKGKEFSSKEFALFVEKITAMGKHIIFIIGGPYGFSEQIYSRANYQISLSKMTFSHQMVRLIFLEQLYRACTIIKGEAYHHE